MFNRILIPLDGSELGELALPYAEELAEAFNWLKQSKIREDTLDENPVYRCRSCSPS